MFKAINEFLHRASEGAEQRRISRTLDRPSRGNADTGAFVDLYLTLPDRWRPGLAPGRGDASRIADPDLVALAYDGRYREHDAPSDDLGYWPALMLRLGGNGSRWWEPERGLDEAARLDATEEVVRGAWAEEGRPISTDRVQLPAGEAIRIEVEVVDSVGGRLPRRRSDRAHRSGVRGKR